MSLPRRELVIVAVGVAMVLSFGAGLNFGSMSCQSLDDSSQRSLGPGGAVAHNKLSEGDKVHASRALSTKRETVVLAVVSCGMSADLLVLLKSVLYNFNSKYDLHIFAFTDDKAKVSKTDRDLFRTISNLPYVTLEELDVHKVGISDSHLNLFRTCAGARLAFPTLEALKDVEKLIYIDTDMLVVDDLGDLWDEFAAFNSSQHSGMTQQATQVHRYGWYLSPDGAQSVCKPEKGDPKVCVPFYGLTGLNSGTYLMYLARMRNLKPRPLYDELMEIVNGPAKENVHKFQLGDQDVLNYYFYHHPDQLHEVSCEWNYRMDSFCKSRPSILHGNRKAFHFMEDTHPNLWTETWKAYQKIEFHSLMDPKWEQRKGP